MTNPYSAPGSGPDPLGPPLLFTVPQAARMLSLGVSTVETLVASAELPSLKIGRARRIPRDAIQAFIERRTCGAA